MKLLIIEDEKDIALPLKKSLESHGFVVDFAEDGATGLRDTHPGPERVFSQARHAGLRSRN